MLGDLQGHWPCPVQRQALGESDTLLCPDHGHLHAKQVLSKGRIQSRELLPKTRGQRRLPLRQPVTAYGCLEELL